MSGDKDYDENLDKARKIFEHALDHAGELPPFMRPESQEVSEEVQQLSDSIRDAVLRGDREAISEHLLRTSKMEQLYRSSTDDDGDLSELEQAREKRRKKRIAELRKEAGGDDEDDQDRENDSRE